MKSILRSLEYFIVVTVVRATAPSCDTGYNCTEVSDLNPSVLCSPPKYYTPAVFPKFTVHPNSAIRNSESPDRMTLTCNISNIDNEFNIIIWEHNGTTVNDPNDYTIVVTPGSDFNSSSLIINTTPIESEGTYRCRVDYQHGNFSLVSREAHFDSPRFSGWVDNVYNSPQDKHTLSTSNVTILSIEEGQSLLVLQCTPSTNDPSIANASIEWKRNGKHIHPDMDDNIAFLRRDQSLLLVRNFSIAFGEENTTFECLLSGLGYLTDLRRSFIVKTAKGQNQTSLNDIITQNQTVLAGATVTLFCLSSSAHSSDGITWSFENTTLNTTGEVLLISDVTVEMEGWYSCLTASGEVHSAYVGVIGKVSIQSSTHPITDKGILKIPMEVFETSNNHSISLSCQVGSRPSPWSNIDNIICIEWFFRGSLVNSSCRDLNESQLDVVSEMTENSLILSVDDPWQLIGSIQCFVRISSPATDGHPCTALSADVHVVAKGKPNPPTAIIEMEHSNNIVFYFKRQFAFNSSYCSTYTKLGANYTYVVEVTVNDNSAYKLCTFTRDLMDQKNCNGWLDLNTKDWVTNYPKDLYIRVAAMVNGVLSDFLPYKYTQDNCRIPLINDKNPPKPQLDDTGTKFKVSPSSNLWEVTQDWTLPENAPCDYPHVLYRSDFSLTCDHPYSHESINKRSMYVQYSTACRTECNLAVTFLVVTDQSELQSQSNITITTGPLAPSLPPTLEHAQRIDGSTFSINVMLPEKDISCEPPFLRVNYTSLDSEPTFIDIDMANCTPTNARSSSKPSFLCPVNHTDICWGDYLRVAYENSVDNVFLVSNYSNALYLLPSSEGDTLDGVTSLNATTDSGSKIDINIILPDYLTCLVRKGRLNATICHAPKNGSECNEAESDCVDVIVSGDPVPFENLTSGTTYCFVVTLSSVNSSWKLSRQFTTNKDASVTTVHSLITTGHSNGDSNTDPIIGQSMIMIVVFAGIGGLVALSICVICMTATCLYYRKKNVWSNSYHRLNNQDNESISDRDLVTVNGQEDHPESVHSFGTDLTCPVTFQIQRFLSDKVVADGDEDRPSMCDTLSHQGEGIMEDQDEIERESLQGSADNGGGVTVQVETESTGSTGSLKERQKMINEIQRNNHLLKKEEETVELSPLTPSTVIASPSSVVSVPQPSGNPLPNRYHRAMPSNGYVRDVGTNGRHDLTCTPTVVRNVPGGVTPPITNCTLTNHNPAPNRVTGGYSGLPSYQHTQTHHTPKTMDVTSFMPVQPSQTSSIPVQPLGNVQQITSFSNGERIDASSNSGYVQSPLEGHEVNLGQHETHGNDSLPNLNHHGERAVAGVSSSSGGYVQSFFEAQQQAPSSGMHVVGQSIGNDSFAELLSDKNDDILKSNLMVTHVPLTDGYVCDPSATNIGGERQMRGGSTESGNEDDSTSNEGDLNSVFDDDLSAGDSTVISGRPRSTVTSGFSSGSSESTSPEPPNKLSPPSTPPPSPPTSAMELQLPNTTDLSSPHSNNHFLQHPPSLSSISGNLPSNLSSNLAAHQPYSFSPSGASQVPIANANPAYRPSSFGSSGYMTNSFQSYHSSSGNSQTSRSASDELNQELGRDENDFSGKYTVPSLLSSSKSSSPSLPHMVISNGTAEDTLPEQHSVNASQHSLCYDIRPPLSAVGPAFTDYMNTKDIALYLTGERGTGISFEFPSNS